jgi:hypothetical protein
MGAAVRRAAVDVLEIVLAVAACVLVVLASLAVSR